MGNSMCHLCNLSTGVTDKQTDRRDRWTVKLTDRWTNGWKQMDWRRGGPCYRDVMMHLKRERKKSRIPLHTSPPYRTQTQTRTCTCIRRNISFSILAAATERSMIYAFTCGPIFPLHSSPPVFSQGLIQMPLNR